MGSLLGAIVGAAYWKLSLWTDVLGVLWFTISVLCLIPFCSIALFSTDRRYFLVCETSLFAAVPSVSLDSIFQRIPQIGRH